MVEDDHQQVVVFLHPQQRGTKWPFGLKIKGAQRLLSHPLGRFLFLSSQFEDCSNQTSRILMGCGSPINCTGCSSIIGKVVLRAS